MSVVEALAAFYWLTYVLAAEGQGGVYHFPVVLAGGILLLGLTVESAVVSLFLDGDWDPLAGVSVGVVEVIAWTQWANVVLAGLWSRTGIGPAFVIFTGLLAAVHAVECNLLFDESPRLRHIITAVVEATTVTTAWVLFDSPLLAVVVLVAGFTLEHGYRVSDT